MNDGLERQLAAVKCTPSLSCPRADASAFTKGAEQNESQPTGKGFGRIRVQLQQAQGDRSLQGRRESWSEKVHMLHGKRRVTVICQTLICQTVSNGKRCRGYIVKSAKWRKRQIIPQAQWKGKDVDGIKVVFFTHDRNLFFSGSNAQLG